jgi:hypothetical protein
MTHHESSEPVTAADVRVGDVILLDDVRDVLDDLNEHGTPAVVTDLRAGDYWMNDGRHVPGRAIGWRSLTGTSSGVMFREAADVLQRVIQ